MLLHAATRFGAIIFDRKCFAIAGKDHGTIFQKRDLTDDDG